MEVEGDDEGWSCGPVTALEGVLSYRGGGRRGGGSGHGSAVSGRFLCVLRVIWLRHGSRCPASVYRDHARIHRIPGPRDPARI